MTPTCCSSTSGIPPSTGCIYAPRTRSNRPSRRFGFDQGDQGPGITGGGHGDGLQADRSSAVAVAGGQRTTPWGAVRAGAVFHQALLERPVDITPEPSPDTPVSEVALTTLDPQDLTISRKSGFATSRE